MGEEEGHFDKIINETSKDLHVFLALSVTSYAASITSLLDVQIMVNTLFTITSNPCFFSSM